jgi:trans-aconitate 2-methyltransferase
MAWDPAQYHKFQDARSAPFEDLVALGVWRPGLSIVDLGCGTGELTARLLERSPGATIVGVDSSETMLARAKPLERPGLRFEKGAIEEWSPAAPVDLIFSHAALQWCDFHAQLFPRLASHLAPGGQLLVQMPSNHGHLAHLAVLALANVEPWHRKLGGYSRHSPLLSIDNYAEQLHRAGLPFPTVIEKVYGVELPDPRGVLEWIKGTLLVPYLERLDADDRPLFLEEIGKRLDVMLEGRPYYYAFKRTLIAARKPA